MNSLYSTRICRKMLTTDEKLLVNNIAELISARACKKTLDIFDNENVEHLIKTLCTSYILYILLSAVNITYYHFFI